MHHEYAPAVAFDNVRKDVRRDGMGCLAHGTRDIGLK